MPQAAPLLGSPCPGVVDKDATHCYCRGRKEVCSALEVDRLWIHQTQVCLMYDVGRLESHGPRGLSSSHIPASEFSKLVVDQWQQASRRRPIAFRGLPEKLCCCCLQDEYSPCREESRKI